MASAPKSTPIPPLPGQRRTQPWVGRPLPRFEDARLVRGEGRFTDDLNEAKQTFGVFVRCPHAHARIRAIDAAGALAVPGVIAVLTGADYIADGCKPLPTWPSPAGALDVDDPVFKDAPGAPILITPQWPLAPDVARFPGEAVALVVARDKIAARDGAEAVVVDYEPLPAATDMAHALAPDAPVLWPEHGNNVGCDNAFGDAAATETALAGAHLVVEQSFHNQRIAVSFMEPRGGIGGYDAKTQRYTLTSGSQGVHRIRMTVAGALGVGNERVRVVSTDTGGGFGSRNDGYPEQIAVCWAARRVGAPVKWTNDRSESFLTDYHGRDMTTRARIGFDKDGAIVAMALDILSNVGAHTVSFVQLHNHWRVAPTVYRVPLAAFRLRAVLTNTVPTGPFRGAGRPEAMLAMERCIDIAARRLGIDRIELRRRNMVRKSELPYRSATGLTYDSGDFHGAMRAAMDAADWTGFEKRRRAARKAGKLLGIGLSNYIETPVGAPIERVDVRVAPNGLELVIGTHSTGQGHETSFAQVMADLLGVTPDQVAVIYGDTDKVVSGGGSHSDRSMRLGSALMTEASATIVAQARLVAAALLEVEPDAVAYDDGLFVASGRNRRLSILDIAEAIETTPSLPASLRKRLAASASIRGRIPAYPTGCAVCEVEIDEATGQTRIVRYTAVDDVGQPINPLILHGQVHGGVVQAIGQALGETVAYDKQSGQVLSASFMDYAMPRADTTPFFDVRLVEDPTHGNPLRIKGGGEGGTTPGPAAIVNAICNALAPLGVEHIAMPATPARVWRTIKKHRSL